MFKITRKLCKKQISPTHLHTGKAAEQRARKHLEQHGFKTIATNVNSRFGEIDIIMQRIDEIVFVEVRYRSNTSHVSAAQSIDKHKQSKLINAARFFLQKNPQYNQYLCRFDVITIESTKNILQWHPCAFTLDDHSDFNL